MKNNNLKWTSMIIAIMLFAFITSCNNGQTEQNTAEETEGTVMSEGMDMTQQENEAASAGLEGVCLAPKASTILIRG